MQHLAQTNNTLPERIQVDNGSEFISKALDKWAYDNKVILDFSRPGKPTDNPYIEWSATAVVQWQFSGRHAMDECLNVNWFLSLEDAREKIEAWRQEYNQFRPHSSIDYKTPDQVHNNKENNSRFSTFLWSEIQ